MTTPTDIPCTMTVNGHAITGREWIVDVTNPTEVSADRTAYVLRNAGKTRPVYTFLGVPYARQPVGQYRFRPALKVAPTAAIDASRFGQVAPQGYSQEAVDTGRGRTDLGVERGLSAWGALGTREGEACLNLNIYSPTLNPAANLPVIVHFHGGGSNYLSACDDRMSGHRLAPKGVIVVRVEYRLGNLGHYDLPGMDGEGDYQGVNFSLTDAIAALQWVQDHIADMGGDETRVTIMGGSAGGNMCAALLSNAAARPLFHRVMSSSASAGTNNRWQAQMFRDARGYKTHFGYRHTAITSAAGFLRDSQNSNRSLAAAIADVGLTEAIRQHMTLEDFMALDEGESGIQLDGGIRYQATRSLTIMNDGETCFHNSNRDFAFSGDVPSTHQCMFWVCENEASVIGGGAQGNLFFFPELQDLAYATPNEWARSPVYSTEWNASAATPTWGALDFTQPQFPWLGATEPNTQIFGHGYQHTAYSMARAVDAAGGSAYLGWCNWTPTTYTAKTQCGHTDDEPMWFNNPLWAHAYPAPGGVEPITTRDIRMADCTAQTLANFAASGNPNTPYASATDFDLFAVPLVQALTAFDPVQKNWNRWGNANRNSMAAPDTITNVPFFWDHAWDWYDARVMP